MGEEKEGIRMNVLERGNVRARRIYLWLVAHTRRAEKSACEIIHACSLSEGAAVTREGLDGRVIERRDAGRDEPKSVKQGHCI